MNQRLLPLIALLISVSTAFAGIEKIAIPTDQGLQLFWWPQVDPGTPWKFNEAVSRQNAVKMFIPEGSNFSNAETVMYAKANFKPRVPETKTLQALIDSDTSNTKEHAPGIKIEPVAPVPDGDGKMVRILSFTPANGQGNFEWVAYGEDGDFFLIFTVSSRNKQGLERALPAFKSIIASYHHEP